MLTGYTAPKILWLRQNRENWKKTQRFAPRLPELLAYRCQTDGAGMLPGPPCSMSKTGMVGKVVDYIAEDLSGKLPPEVLKASSRGPARRALQEVRAFKSRRRSALAAATA
jgi:hypothetical protein